MKTISAGLKAFLDSATDVLRIELVKITLPQSAGVIYLTSLDNDIEYSGHTYLSGNLAVNPGFKRGNVTTGVGTDTKTMELTLYCTNTTRLTVSPDMAVPTFADYGGFDNAIVEIDCLPVPVPAPGTALDTSNGTYNIWTGVVGDVRADRTEVELEVSSMLRYLQGAFPRNYSLPTCNNSLYDSACGLDKSNYMTPGVVGSGLGNTTTWPSNLTQADDYFNLGWVRFTSGVNQSLIRTVKTYANTDGKIVITDPLPNLPATGDEFNIYPGCDKLQTTCTNKFNNLVHFRGFPYMPNPMTLMAGAGNTPGANNSGGSTYSGGGGVKNRFSLK